MKRWCRMRLRLPLAVSAAALACEFSSEVPGTVTFAGLMSGARERPAAVTTSATGHAVAVVNSGGTMTYSVTWTGLSGTVTGAHLHGPADSSGTAGVLIDFQNPPAGTTNTSITLTSAGSAMGTVTVSPTAVITATVSGDSLQKLLYAGLVYVNVHTVANPDGEIRGNLRRP